MWFLVNQLCWQPGTLWNILSAMVSFKGINHRCFSPVSVDREYPNVPNGPGWCPHRSPSAAGGAAHRCLDNSSLSSRIMEEVHREAWSPPGFAKMIKSEVKAPVLATQKLCQVHNATALLRRKCLRGYRLQGSTPRACPRLGLSRCWLYTWF